MVFGELLIGDEDLIYLKGDGGGRRTKRDRRGGLGGWFWVAGWGLVYCEIVWVGLVFVCMDVSRFICLCVCLYVYMCVYVHIYIYISIYTYTQTYIVIQGHFIRHI